MKKKYSAEYKEYAIEGFYECKKSGAQYARELGISYSTFMRWLSDFDKSKLSPIENEEIKKLKKRLQKVEMENEILKKASAYFAQHMT